ncbi:MAG: hypothetical protein AAFQ80_14495 [Cyanobacteria bacterium J06621_8]
MENKIRHLELIQGVISRRHATLKKEGDNYRIYDGDCRVPSRNLVEII